jgi:hypothetical protein
MLGIQGPRNRPVDTVLRRWLSRFHTSKYWQPGCNTDLPGFCHRRCNGCQGLAFKGETEFASPDSMLLKQHLALATSFVSLVARYMVWQPHSSLDTTLDFVTNCDAQWNAGSALPHIITLKSSGQLIGMLEARPRGHVVNISYVLARSQWDQGLMVEAIGAFTTMALGCQRFSALR